MGAKSGPLHPAISDLQLTSPVSLQSARLAAPALLVSEANVRRTQRQRQGVVSRARLQLTARINLALDSSAVRARPGTNRALGPQSHGEVRTPEITGMNRAPTNNPSLRAWVDTVCEHTRPAQVRWWTGSRAEREQLAASMVARGRLVPLDTAAKPRCFLYLSHLDHVASDPAYTFMSTHRSVDVGPTNKWMSCDDAHALIWPLLHEAMRDRTLYVVPYLLGMPNSPFCRVGVELTDSPYIALCLDTLTQTGKAALDHLGSSLSFARGLHSSRPQPPDRRFVVHFPDTVETWSMGTESLEDSLLASGFQGRRLASAQAREEGWLAENMAIAAITDPAGRTIHVAIAAANGCADAELVTMRARGWKVELCSRNACWMRPGRDGRLWAICPELGRWERMTDLFERLDEPRERIAVRDAIFSDTVSPLQGGVEPRGPLERARCLVRLHAQGGAADRVRAAEGVPLSAIIFCGRHAQASPVVYQARSWRHGVYVGATLVDELNGTNQARHDPMGMLASCGYNLGDYFAHWLAVGRKLHSPPEIFHINWFRTDAEGRRLWRGGADNLRIFEWIAGRVHADASARATAIGWVPELGALDTAGLDVPPDRLLQLTSSNHGPLLGQAERARAFLMRFGDSLPPPLLVEHRYLVRHLHESLH